VVRTITFVPRIGVSGDAPGCLKAVHAGHPDVHQHDVGTFLTAFDGFRTVLGVADDVNVLLIARMERKPRPDQGVIVGDEDADVRRHTAHRGSRDGDLGADPPAGSVARPGLAAAGERGGALSHARKPVAGRLADGVLGGRLRRPFVEHLDKHPRRRPRP